MNKEQKIFFKKVEKDINKLIKLSAKQYAYKPISNSLYKKTMDFLRIRYTLASIQNAD